MPGLNVPMKPLADATYQGAGKRIPHRWSQPTGTAAQHYNLAFKEGDHAATPDPTSYLRPASTNRLHVRQAEIIGGKLKEFAHTMLDAFEQAHELWRQQAAFQGITIAGPLAMGAQGCLVGPQLYPTIVQLSYPQATHNLLHWRDAVARGLSESFGLWQQGVTVPGLPWYPLFALFPTPPVAPPMPNVPTPLSTCSSSAMDRMTAPGLEAAMLQHFSMGDTDGRFATMARAIGTAVATSFSAWLSTQQVMLVMGTGPVPVAPGPVVAGVSLPGSGHLSA